MVIAMSIFTGKLNEAARDEGYNATASECVNYGYFIKFYRHSKCLFYVQWPASYALGWAGAGAELLAGITYMCGYSPLYTKIKR